MTGGREDRFDPPPDADPAQDGAPVSPLVGMALEATTLHTVYEMYVAAGFSQSQAIYICGVLLAESIRKAP